MRKPTKKQLIEFIQDLIDEPFRIETDDEREKTLYEAKALLNGEIS